MTKKKVLKVTKLEVTNSDLGKPVLKDLPVKIFTPKKKEAQVVSKFIEGEEVESERLEIFEEDPFDYQKETDLLPVRILDDFKFYDAARGNRFASLDDVGHEGTDILAIGYVKAEKDEDILDEEDEGVDLNEFESEVDIPNKDKEFKGQLVRLSSIFYWDIKYTEDGSSIIYIRTTFAWYRLLNPSPEYYSKYRELLLRTRLANITINAMKKDPKLTYEEFLHNLPELSEQCINFPECPKLKIMAKDFLKLVAFLKDEIECYIIENEEYGFFDIPLFQKLMETPNDEFDFIINKDKTEPTHRIVRKQGATKGDNTTAPVFTKTISKLAYGYIDHLNNKYEGENNIDDLESKGLEGSKSFHHALNFGRSIESDPIWINEPINLIGKYKIYSQVKMDEITLQEGDFIIINDSKRFTNKVVRICLLLELNGTKKMLGRTLLLGKDTLMEELAYRNELFLTDEMLIYPISSFIAKTKVNHMSLDQDESKFKDSFFFRYFYEIDTGAYIDANLALRNGWRNKLYPNEATNPQIIEDSIKFKSFEYHLYDFVYIIPQESNLPYEIGQILLLKKDEDENNFHKYSKAEGSLKFYIQLYRRHTKVVDLDAIGSKYGPKKYIPDPRHIYRTNKYSIVSIEKLEGRCYVKHIDDISDLDNYKQENDCFYIDSKEFDQTQLQLITSNEINICKKCEDNRVNKLNKVNDLKDKVKPLVALDLFSGCGGLTLGLKHSGMIHTKYSIEFNPGAAITFKKNFPDATVYNQCANFLLKRAINESQGKKNTEAKDFMGKNLPTMPKPGQIDLIYCGPPCQGFSGINRFKKANDIKNSLIATTMSYVDFYRPKYFMLENVRGLLSFRLGGKQKGLKVEGGIKMGYVKFILRCLTHMGYQCRISIQQAGNFGLAQSRRRVIIWGTLLGLSLPFYPLPTHCFNKLGSVNLPLPNNTSYVANSRTNDCAPHPSQTIYDAIADLEGFEYVNPNLIYPENKVNESTQFSKFKKYLMSNQLYVGKMKADYVIEPFSEFQRLSRLNSSICYNHVTRSFNDLTVERICRISMVPGSDHSSLPEKLKPWCLSHKDSAASRHNGWKGLFGRLDFKSHFQTALTEIQPMGKQGAVIHPCQNRVLTVRECARAQGFPDNFIFYSYIQDDTKDMHRQVGNAVPPPLASALAKELLYALVRNYEGFERKEIDITEAEIKSYLEDTQKLTFSRSVAIKKNSSQLTRSTNSKRKTRSNRLDFDFNEILPKKSFLFRERRKVNFKEDSESEIEEINVNFDKSEIKKVTNENIKKKNEKFLCVEIPKKKIRYISNQEVETKKK